jgi:hypothetical protein
MGAAITLIKTSPGPGFGIGTYLISSVLGPVSIAHFIVF